MEQERNYLKLTLLDQLPGTLVFEHIPNPDSSTFSLLEKQTIEVPRRVFNADKRALEERIRGIKEKYKGNPALYLGDPEFISARQQYLAIQDILK